MKIIHIIPNLRKGGAERIALDICNEIHSQGEHEVLLITFQPDNAYTFLTESLPWKVVPADIVPSITGKASVSVSELQETIEAFQPDIIHAHLFKTIMVLSQIHYEAHYFIHFHDNMHQLKPFSWSHCFQKKMWTDWYERRLVLTSFKKKSVSAIAISNDTANYARKVIPPTVQVHQLLNAIDRKRFYAEVKKKASNRIVMIGSLVENKNQLLAIQVIEQLLKREIDVRLDLVGDGVNRSKLEEYVSQNELSNFITFHGKVDHPENVLREASLYLHTSKSEAFGLVLIEAMAAGLPVVCTNGGGNKDLILEGENGFLINIFDAEALADKVELLIKNPEQRLEMGKKAQDFSEQFDISVYTAELTRIYSSKLLTKPFAKSE